MKWIAGASQVESSWASTLTCLVGDVGGGGTVGYIETYSASEDNEIAL